MSPRLKTTREVLSFGLQDSKGEYVTKRATDAFIRELNRLVDRFRDEWDLTYAEAIGCLEMVKLEIAREDPSGDEEDDDGQLGQEHDG